jgi:hypothetical protein
MLLGYYYVHGPSTGPVSVLNQLCFSFVWVYWELCHCVRAQLRYGTSAQFSLASGDRACQGGKLTVTYKVIHGSKF